MFALGHPRTLMGRTALQSLLANNTRLPFISAYRSIKVQARDAPRLDRPMASLNPGDTVLAKDLASCRP